MKQSEHVLWIENVRRRANITCFIVTSYIISNIAVELNFDVIIVSIQNCCRLKTNCLSVPCSWNLHNIHSKLISNPSGIICSLRIIFIIIWCYNSSLKSCIWWLHTCSISNNNSIHAWCSSYWANESCVIWIISITCWNILICWTLCYWKWSNWKVCGKRNWKRKQCTKRKTDNVWSKHSIFDLEIESWGSCSIGVRPWQS